MWEKMGSIQPLAWRGGRRDSRDGGARNDEALRSVERSVDSCFRPLRLTRTSRSDLSKRPGHLAVEVAERL